MFFAKFFFTTFFTTFSQLFYKLFSQLFSQLFHNFFSNFFSNFFDNYFYKLFHYFLHNFLHFFSNMYKILDISLGWRLKAFLRPDLTFLVVSRVFTVRFGSDFVWTFRGVPARGGMSPNPLKWRLGVKITDCEHAECKLVIEDFNIGHAEGKLHYCYYLL